MAEQQLAKTPQQLHQERIEDALAEVERRAGERDCTAIALRNWHPQDGPRSPLIAGHAKAAGLKRLPKLRTWLRFPSPAPETLFPSNNLAIGRGGKRRR